MRLNVQKSGEGLSESISSYSEAEQAYQEFMATLATLGVEEWQLSQPQQTELFPQLSEKPQDKSARYADGMEPSGN
jgi:hypothetical protein